MYILVAIFFTGAGNQNYHYRAATNLGEYSSIAACQAAASATQKVSLDMKENAKGEIRFVCAKK